MQTPSKAITREALVAYAKKQKDTNDALTAQVTELKQQLSSACRTAREGDAPCVSDGVCVVWRHNRTIRAP